MTDFFELLQKERRGNALAPGLSKDTAVNDFFNQVAEVLMQARGLEFSLAGQYISEYLGCFTDPTFCKSIGVPVQDSDFFFHESPGGMAARIVYYMVEKGNDPSPEAFIEWRAGMS